MFRFIRTKACLLSSVAYMQNICRTWNFPDLGPYCESGTADDIIDHRHTPLRIRILLISQEESRLETLFSWLITTTAQTFEQSNRSQLVNCVESCSDRQTRYFIHMWEILIRSSLIRHSPARIGSQRLH